MNHVLTFLSEAQKHSDEYNGNKHITINISVFIREQSEVGVYESDSVQLPVAETCE